LQNSLQFITQAKLTTSLIKAIAGATNGETLFIQKRPNLANQDNFMMLIVTTIASTLLGA
jgi:hypothetical protein